MALPSTGVIEIRTTGSDLNGGGFNSARGGTDYSQQDSPQATGTASSSGTTLTATTGIFTSAMVGNYVTNGTTWVEITAYTSSTVVTIDRDPSWTSQSIKVGGALATPYKAIVTVGVGGNTFWLKYGTYNVGTSILFDHTTQYTGYGYIYLYGYNTTRGDGPTSTNRPTLKATAAIDILAGDNYAFLYAGNIIFDGDSGTGTAGITYYPYAYGSMYISDCEFKGFSGAGIGKSYGYFTNAIVTRCESHHCGYGFGNDYNATASFNYCVSHNNTYDGFGRFGAGTFIGCISYSNGSDGFLGYANGGIMKYYNCTAYGNTGNGFACGGGTVIQYLYNCISYGNGGYGISGIGEACYTAYGNNTSGNSTSVTLKNGIVTLTANPFVDSSNGNFALNNVSGGGTSCRTVAFPGVFPGGLTTGYLDIGAVQSISYRDLVKLIAMRT